MNSEERFKKSLDDLLNSKEFSFDEANWEKARDMIDASKESRKRRVVPFILAALLFVGSLFTGFYLLFDTFAPAPEKLAQRPSPAIRTSTAPSAKLETASPQAAALKPKGNATPAKQAPASVPGGSVKQLPEPSRTAVTTKASVNTEIPAAATEPVALNTIPVPATSEVSHAAENITVQNVPVVNAPVKENTEAETPGTTTRTAVEEIPVATASPLPVASNTLASGETSSTKEETTKNNSDLIVSAPSNTDQMQDSALATQPLAPDSVKPVASLSPADNDHGELGKPKRSIILFSAEAGSAFLYGWQNQQGSDASGFNPVVGINYFSTINTKASLSFGLQYSSVNNLNLSTHTTKITRLNLGEESNVSVFTPTKMHYAIIPLRFNYTLNSRNTIGIGANIAYLLNVEGKVERYDEKISGIENRTVTKTTGYTEGFKMYDTQASVFYKRAVYRNLALNLELFYGLTDIKDNAFFKSNVFERNAGLKLTLVYNFLKK